MKELLYEVRCLKSSEDMILALTGQFKQLSRIPLSHLNFSGSWDNCLNCPVSARIISSLDEKLLFLILNQWRIDFPIVTRQNCNSLKKMMLNAEQLMAINNFNGYQVTINYQLSQRCRGVMFHGQNQLQMIVKLWLIGLLKTFALSNWR